MKIAVISDIHGSLHWKKIIPSAGNYDKIIFLGDYFDAWENVWPQQLDNARDIITFKKKFSSKIDLCLGNHDTSYIRNGQCSGYQYNHEIEIKEFFKENKAFFNVVYAYGSWVFCHAGISEEWMKQAGLSGVSEINGFYAKKPNYFGWFGPECHGDNPNEGPLWIRPYSLLKYAIPGYNQAVGHTEQPGPPFFVEGKSDSVFSPVKENAKYVFTDTHTHDYMTVVDTENDGVVFEKLA